MGDFERVRSEVREELQEACKREGGCEFIELCAGEIASKAVRPVEAISGAQVNGRTERLKEQIASLCTGNLVDQGCWNNPLCPADPKSDFKLRRSRRYAI